jgi:hypothetical protein
LATPNDEELKRNIEDLGRERQLFSISLSINEALNADVILTQSTRTLPPTSRQMSTGEEGITQSFSALNVSLIRASLH